MRRSAPFLYCLLPVLLLAACTISARRPGAPPPTDGLAPAEVQARLAANEWGQVLHCRIEDGQARFFGGFKNFTADDFSIVAGEQQIVDLFSDPRGEQDRLYLTFRPDGGYLVACRDAFRDHGASCDLFRTRFSKHGPAIAEGLDVANFIEGAYLSCRWPAP